ncbi:MAG: histidinol-phosphate transaminase [Bdellovibrionales bacterium]|nr:histidinol-phosphate transaminase [Bdellovibrionales bacterium]
MKVSEEILNLKPYSPGKPIEETKREYGLNKVYKLASNENPLGPSPKAVKAMTEAMTSLHRYPDASFYELRQAYAKHFQLSSHEITFGNGSNELIDLLIRVFCAPGESVLTSESAFIAYKVCAQAARVQILETPMKEDLKFDLNTLQKTLKEKQQNQKIRLVFIANPNNPTGTYVSTSELDAFLKFTESLKDILVVIDEAYLEFVRAKDYPSGLEAFKKYKNVAVLKTLSKVYGIAGIRVGALIAQPEIIELIDRVRNPFNVNSLAQAAALATLEDKDYLEQVQNINWSGLDSYYEELEKMDVRYWRSEANFILIDTFRDHKKIFEALLRHGVIVRPAVVRGKSSFIRLSVGLKEENEAAISALNKVLKDIDKIES